MDSPYLLLLILTLLATPIEARETITFPSADGILITADTYIQNDDPQTPFIVLFHQASWSRGEYRETAPRLNEMGFNCIAIDQRSGNAIKGVSNETKQRAAAAGKSTEFLDAIPDMLAAINYAKDQFSDGAVIGVGSSYSSALILKLAGDDTNLVDAVASFSPGEYFSPSNLIRSSAANITSPTFITSARNENSSWQPIFDTVPTTTNKSSFLPTTSGQHGSRALWPEFPDSESYWVAFSEFLKPWIPSISNYRVEKGLPQDGSADLDPAEGTNVSHLVNYALGDQAFPNIIELNGETSFQFRRLKNRTDLTYSVETSDALSDSWTQIWSSESTPYSAGTSPSEKITIPLPADAETQFARLRISLAQ